MKKIFLTLSLVLFVIPFGISQDLPSYIPTDGLVAYYPFNGNANDASGNDHHATVNGAILSSDRDGNNDKAYEFSHQGASFGDNHQSIYIPFHADFQSENFTVGIWFKADAYGWDGNSKIESTLFSKREDSDQPNQATYRIQLSSNFTRSEIGGPDGDDEIPCSANSVQPIVGAWYHAASTYDGTTLKQYINGVKVSEINCGLSHNAISTSGIMLGQTWQYNGYWYHLDGKLDEFMVYNKAMTEKDMENYYVSATSDILLNGTVSAENNQIKNVADPTEAQDAVTKNYTYSKAEVDALVANLQNQIDEPVYTIGHWPELGGYVFMVSADGKHGLVAETEDQGLESWYNAQNLISNPSNHSADGQNFTDWRLPTRYELAQMYSHKSEIESAGGDAFGTKTYWTSNQSIYSVNGLEEETAWRQNFGTGIQYSSNAIRLVDDLFVRSVREF
jgi:hypothetical protein